MGKIYVGDANNIAREVKGIYVGDANGIARKVLKGYVGDANGVARQFYAAFDPTLSDQSLYQNTSTGRNRSVVLCTKAWLQEALNAGYTTFNALLTLNVTELDWEIDIGLTNSASATSISNDYKLAGPTLGSFTKTLSVPISGIVSMLNDNLYFNMIVQRDTIVRATGTITNIYMS